MIISPRFGVNFVFVKLAQVDGKRFMITLSPSAKVGSILEPTIVKL